MSTVKPMLRVLVITVICVATQGTVYAQQITLKLHHMLPASANVPTLVLDVWANKIESESNGRLKIESYPAMSLGGTPPELMGQIAEGEIDIVWAVLGYTPGRFPSTEVFELPFMVNDSREASCAFWKMFESDLIDTEFKDLKVLGTWVHGPGLLHTTSPVRKVEDLQKMRIRGGSRLVNHMLRNAGASPVGIPVPTVAAAISKGRLDGTTIPWEVSSAVKVLDQVSYHTEFKGPALYTLSFVHAMNKRVYDSLDDDLKLIIDRNSGLEYSIYAAEMQLAADIPARQAALNRGNEVFVVNETDEWDELVHPVYKSWVADLHSKGMDGHALIDQANNLMNEDCNNARADDF